MSRPSLVSRIRRPVKPALQLRMAPLIDVVFLLLVFFLLTASFRSQEGILPIELPKLGLGPAVEMEPLDVHLQTESESICVVQIGADTVCEIDASRPEGFAVLARELQAVLVDQGRRLQDPIRLHCTSLTRWDHVVKAYDTLCALQVENVIFMPAE